LEIEKVEDAKQTPDEPQESATAKKRWVTPKLAMLDIKVNTLGGALKGAVEDLKANTMS